MTVTLNKKTLRDLDVAGKTVLVRVDYNVPLHPDSGDIGDDSRIRASLPTVQYLLQRGCKVVICSHLGRPKGMAVEELRMGRVARRLSQLLGARVAQASDCVGPSVQAAVEALAPGSAILLENLRFNPGEEANDPEFALALASLADIYVDDAFATAHRAHASTEGVTRFLPSVAGLLMARELEMLGRVLESPERPFAAIRGGAKVSDKIAVLENLAGRVDILLIGGGMAASFLKAMGLGVGDSSVEEERVHFAAQLIRTARGKGLELLLPVDFVIADRFSETADHREVDASNIPSTWRIMDIGKRTIALYEEALSRCKTVVWNGPMGVFEWKAFSLGTARVARCLAGLESVTTVVGGGSTAEAVDNLCLVDKMTHVSTGGGASLELVGGQPLPGVAALMNRAEVSSRSTLPGQ